MQKIKFLTAIASLFVWTANAQVLNEDADLLASYKSEIPYFQELITGGQYEEAPKNIEGHPFYFSRQFENGNLRINGVTYSDVPLMYDEFRDQVLTFHPIQKQKLLINPEKVEAFRLANGEEFRFFEGNENYYYNGNGLYQVLNKKAILVLVKHYKTTKAKQEVGRFTDEFIEKEARFLWKEGQFYSISKAYQVAPILGLEKKILKKKMKAMGLRFKGDPDKYLLEAVDFAEEFLTQSAQ
ncbi:hypothetical protein [Algoriphagus sp. CAU 1675]|uniref:hypothetical protein n=1 Tax=Algoriphagus sp. CAU 1675 TaxID=3032597 RepID=UPI0023DC7402|nr:hypothetical protein [Algoriphagus sp. CAU 1675]MDF2158683.1 hypothetical protein [Algoriphagus sp. CAU 1675]